MKKVFWITGIVIVLLDQVTKLLMLSLPDKDWGWFAFHTVENTGAGFSILQNSNTLLLGISVIIVALLLLFWKKFETVEQFFITFVVGGAIGNILDRILHGHVIDFLDFKVWPIFNIADSFIFIGVFCLIVYAFREKSSWLEKQFGKLKKSLEN